MYVEADQALKVAQYIAKSRGNTGILVYVLHHTSLTPRTHSAGGNTMPSICNSLKQESHIRASLLNGGYKSQLLLLAQGLTRLLIIKY